MQALLNEKIEAGKSWWQKDPQRIWPWWGTQILTDLDHWVSSPDISRQVERIPLQLQFLEWYEGISEKLKVALEDMNEKAAGGCDESHLNPFYSNRPCTRSSKSVMCWRFYQCENANYSLICGWVTLPFLFSSKTHFIFRDEMGK